MTFRLILLIFQVVISKNHPQYGNGWDKSFTLWEQLLDCKPCHSGSGIIPSYVAPNDLIPSHIEKNSHFQPGSCHSQLDAQNDCHVASSRKTSTPPIRSSAL
jgi:hypothetical protein